MHVVQIQKPGKVAIVDQPAPRPGPGEVLVRVQAAGLCGTDLHLYEGLFGTFPAVPGHDLAGVIEETGEGVPRNRIGTRVTIDPAACCARAATPQPLCPACARGATNLCVHGTYMGMTAPGGLSEFVTVPSQRAVPVSAEIDDAAATVLEPVVVALHLLEKIADRPGPCLVIGGGPIGIVAGLLLQDAGRPVVLCEPLEKRRDLALSLGIQKAVSPEEVHGPLDFPVLVEASGHPSAADLISREACPGSTIALVGGATDIPGLIILTRELEVRAVKGGRGLYPEAVDLVSKGKMNPGLLISHCFAVREAARAFQIASRNRAEVTRAVLNMTVW